MRRSDLLKPFFRDHGTTDSAAADDDDDDDATASATAQPAPRLRPRRTAAAAAANGATSGSENWVRTRTYGEIDRDVSQILF